jgi:short-subunit dehydrogenase
MQANKSFENQTFWITGASSGIGKALALELSKIGVRLVLSSRRQAELEKVRGECLHPERVDVFALDLANAPSLEGAYASAESLCGNPIDVIVHCGGISQRAPAVETSAAVDRQMLEVNYFGTVALTRSALPAMIARKSGHIVVVTSLMGIFSSPLRSSYCAAKHALHGYFNALRAETVNHNLHVTIVCPGYIQTDISRNALVGDGSKQGSMDDATGNGISAQQCALAMIRAMRKRKAQVLVGRREILAAYIHRFFPALLRKIISKVKVT